MKQEAKNRPAALPEMFRPILWSYRFEDMDIKKNKRTIITQAINYGNLEHWRWINHAYGQEEVRNVIKGIPKTALRKHVRKLAAFLFGFSEEAFTYASGSSHE